MPSTTSPPDRSWPPPTWRHRIERQRALIDHALGALARRRGRTLGLWALYTGLVFLLGSVMLFTHALRTEAAQVLAHAPEVVVQRLVAGRHDLIPPGYVERLGRIRGVQRVEARLWGYFYDATIRANYTFMVPSAPPPSGQLVVGPALARARGLAPGDLLALRAYSGELHTFLIAEVLPADTELMSADLVLLSEPDFRAFFAYPAGHATDLALSVANPQEVRTVAAKVARALPDARPILREEILRTYASLFDWREGIVLAFFASSLLAFAMLAWDKASGLTAEERRELGVLKAVGWDTGDVLTLKLWEGGLVSISAFLVGYLGAYVHVFHADGALFRPVLQGWAVLYPRFSLPAELDPLQILTLACLTVAPYTAAVLVPSWRAATVDPDAVMRA